MKNTEEIYRAIDNTLELIDNDLLNEEGVKIKRSLTFFARDVKNQIDNLLEQDAFDSWVTYAIPVYEEEDNHRFTYRTIVGDANVICRKACYIDCFGDCSGEEVVDIYVNGKKAYMGGWFPGMHFEIKDSITKEILYSNDFPEWDH